MPSNEAVLYTMQCLLSLSVNVIYQQTKDFFEVSLSPRGLNCLKLFSIKQDRRSDRGIALHQ